MLTACAECGGNVSSAAATCPHCGHPVMPDRTFDHEYRAMQHRDAAARSERSGIGTFNGLFAFFILLPMATCATCVCAPLAGVSAVKAFAESSEPLRFLLFLAIEFVICGVVLASPARASSRQWLMKEPFNALMGLGGLLFVALLLVFFTSGLSSQ